MIWFVLGAFAGATVGVLALALATAAKQDEWHLAYLNARDELARYQEAERHSGDGQ